MTEKLNHIDAAIADLEAWRCQIETAIQTLRHFQSQGTTLPPSGPPKREDQAGTPHDAFFQMTVPDAAQKYLTMAKTTKPTLELAQSLINGGLKSSSKNFPEMVRSVLARDTRFLKVNGEWGLSEWYPAMRKRRASEAPVDSGHIEANAKNKKPEEKQKKEHFSPDSMRGRILDLLDSNSNEIFNSTKVGQRLNEGHLPSVRAALSGLFSGGFILRPERSQYKSKQAA